MVCWRDEDQGNCMMSQAINVLYDIKAATFRNAAALPRKEETQGQWQGLGFLVGGVRLVSKIGDVSELLQTPRLTPLPLSLIHI